MGKGSPYGVCLCPMKTSQWVPHPNQYLNYFAAWFPFPPPLFPSAGEQSTLTNPLKRLPPLFPASFKAWRVWNCGDAGADYSGSPCPAAGRAWAPRDQVSPRAARQGPPSASRPRMGHAAHDMWAGP